ncbi:Gfo/Idh/MocA family protein [Gemmobacter lanyuensis]
MLNGALIGCGFFAQNQMHGWAGIDDVTITAVCDRDSAKAEATATRFGARAYTDAAAMIAAERLDFVDIATTVASHRPLVEMAAGAGLHVICQSLSPKPWPTLMPWSPRWMRLASF